MQEPTNSSDLFSLVKVQMEQPESRYIDPSDIRWCLYARKSTEGEDRQARSIPDQIKDCYETVVQPNNISISKRDHFTEERSAKEAGTRPKFREMIDAIKAGRYNGIISWHPDRIARNMKEAGEIIDLVDRGILKDLRFSRAHFDNTPNGKMMLGITFVLSKHYSEHLSESVSRGNRRIVEEGGILNHVVHGYRIIDKKLVPDGDNYLLIEKAFRMRVDNKSLEAIADFLNKNGYEAHRKSKGNYPYKFDTKKASVLLKQPLYAGIYVYGSHVIKLSEVDEDFTPMISEQEFLAIHGEDSFISHTFRHSKRTVPKASSDFLRGCVRCFECGRSMTTTVTHKKSTGTHYFYFRCETLSCPMKNSGPRGSLILDYVKDFLAEHRFTTESNYKAYRQDAEDVNKFNLQTYAKNIGRLTTELGKKKKEFEDAKKVVADKDNEYAQFYTPRDLRLMKKEIADIKQDLADNRRKLKDQDGAISTYKEYLELFDNVDNYLCNTTSMTAADELIRIFFLNFTVEGVLKSPKSKQKQWSVTSHCLKKPFDDFIKNDDFLNGRGERT